MSTPPKCLLSEEHDCNQTHFPNEHTERNRIGRERRGKSQRAQIRQLQKALAHAKLAAQEAILTTIYTRRIHNECNHAWARPKAK